MKSKVCCQKAKKTVNFNENSTMCLKESYFPDFWKVSSVFKVSPVFKFLGVKFAAKNYCPVSYLFVVSKIFQKLVKNRVFDHLKKCHLFFSIFTVWCQASSINSRSSNSCI